MIQLIITTIGLLCVSSGISLAAMPVNPAYVSPAGSGSACTSESPCALTYANANAAAGDTVYLRGGTYAITDAVYGAYMGAICPVNSGSGTGSGRIIFSAATGETPVLEMTTGNHMYGIRLGDPIPHNYIKIDGITFKNFYTMAYMTNSSSYNEITNCIFYNTEGVISGGFIMVGGLCSPNFNCWVTHNWIHNNVFSKSRIADPCGESADLFHIGHSCCSPGSANTDESEDNHNTVENNLFQYAGHALIDNYGRYQVLRNNTFHNEPWIDGCTEGTWSAEYTNDAFDGLYSHRAVHLSEDFNRTFTYVLVEGNRIGHAYSNPNNPGADALDIAAPQNIVRYNYIYNALNSGVLFKYGHSGVKGGFGAGGIDNRFYNNTIAHNGFGRDGTPPYEELVGISIMNITPLVPTNNIIKNNIVYDSARTSVGVVKDITIWGGTYGDPNDYAVVANNWCTTNSLGCDAYGNPVFANSDMTSPTSQGLFSSYAGYLAFPLPDLRPQNVAIRDSATFLTQANGTGNAATALIVDDALYFQDGTWGSSLAGHQPDWIAIGTVDNVVEISSINYGTNTITLASAKTWADDAPIWLYKKSDGEVVLLGSAPDYGADEFSAYPTMLGITADGVSINQ